jgi:cytochrome c2
MNSRTKIIVLLVSFILILGACDSKQEAQQTLPLSPENLPKTTFQFSTNRDTLLIGEKGTIFHIPANAFVDALGEPYKGQVEIELLEAFSLEDMILGNLTTLTDDGEMLESSGMFRLSIKGNGELLKVNPNVKVMMTIPAVNTKDDSQFFYGKVNEEEDLLWSLADSTDINASNQDLLLGRNLFLRECASCHNINLTHDMTGPALAWVAKRWKTKEDLIAFTRNSEGFAESGNLRARAMIQWAPSSMTAFNDLSDEELDAIYYYIDETARARKIDSTGNELVSDAVYQAYFDRQDSIKAVQDSIQRLRDSIQNSKYQIAINNGSTVLYQMPSDLNSSFFWVNIDRYASEDGPKQKDLKVKLNTGEVNFYLMEVKIIFPKQNSILLAYLNYEANYYSFTEYYQLVTTPFPIGAKAYLMATGLAGDEIHFALKPITIGDNTLEELDLKLISEEDLKQKIKETF